MPRRPFHDIFFSRFGSKRKTWQAVGDEIDPQDVYRQERNGNPRKGARNMVHISPELLVIVYLMNFLRYCQISSLLLLETGNDDGRKIIVEQYHMRCFFL